MSLFNTPKNKSKLKKINLAGGRAYAQSNELELISTLVSSMIKDTSYTSADDSHTRLVELIHSVNPLFAAKAALYARKEFHMRSSSHIVAAELAHAVKGTSWMKDFLSRVVLRPDDATEITNYSLKKFGKPLPNSLKRGISKGLQKFDAYQLAKYRGIGNELSLVDMFNLIHPTPLETQKQAYKDLMDGTLRQERTWEAGLAAAGQDPKKRRAVWEKLLTSGDVGYLALLKNLRNIFIDAVDLMPLACNILTDENRIRKSRVLPFRFMTAYEQIAQVYDSSEVLQAISQAVEISIQNLPAMTGSTLIALDVSGSMQGRPSDIGALFTAMLFKKTRAEILTFDHEARFYNLNKRDTVITLARAIPFTGGGTNFECIFDSLSASYDRIIILSDMQAWQGTHSGDASKALRNYRTRTDADPIVHSFDLAGYGTLAFPESNVNALAGFSEKSLDLMTLLESGRTLVDIVQEVEL
jgi:60 kDa SS-A/Ro ribonucleoprotein